MGLIFIVLLVIPAVGAMVDTGRGALSRCVRCDAAVAPDATPVAR